MEFLRIEWETGYMELSVEAFFPCNLQKARKIAPLINRYCTEEDRAALLSELRCMAEFYQREIQSYKDALEKYKSQYAMLGKMEKSEFNSMKRCEIEIRKNETLKKRTEKNIDLIEGGARNGKI